MSAKLALQAVPIMPTSHKLISSHNCHMVCQCGLTCCRLLSKRLATVLMSHTLPHDHHQTSMPCPPRHPHAPHRAATASCGAAAASAASSDPTQPPQTQAAPRGQVDGLHSIARPAEMQQGESRPGSPTYHKDRQAELHTSTPTAAHSEPGGCNTVLLGPLGTLVSLWLAG